MTALLTIALTLQPALAQEDPAPASEAETHHALDLPPAEAPTEEEVPPDPPLAIPGPDASPPVLAQPIDIAPQVDSYALSLADQRYQSGNRLARTGALVGAATIPLVGGGALAAIIGYGSDSTALTIGGIFAMFAGGATYYVGAPLMAAGSLKANRGLAEMGLLHDSGWGYGAWATWGLSFFFPPSGLVSYGCSVLQIMQNKRTYVEERTYGYGRVSALRLTPVIGHEWTGLALSARF